MGILNIIREMPDNKKKVLSLVTAAVITFVIVTVWISLTKTDDKLAEDQGNKLSSVSPWGMIKEEFSKAFSDFNELTESTSSTSTLDIISSSTVPVEIIEATSTATSTEMSTSSDNIN